MTATDNWGTLVVNEVGGLMSQNKDKVTITVPTRIDGNNISGVGWTLKLNDGYVLVKDDRSGNYTLKEK